MKIVITCMATIQVMVIVAIIVLSILVVNQYEKTDVIETGLITMAKVCADLAEEVAKNSEIWDKRVIKLFYDHHRQAHPDHKATPVPVSR